jgi:hypothetical protein
MNRIYFDKQIFSHLFKGKDSRYVKLLMDIIESKQHLLFCYSHAHLLDLKNDKTSIKYDELAFMKQIVDDNYISYDASEKNTSCYLASPQEAFTQVDYEDDTLSFLSLFDDINLDFATPEQVEQIEKAKRILTEPSSLFDFSALHDLPEEQRVLFNKLIPGKSGDSSMLDWLNSFSGFYNQMNEEKNIYKVLRNIVDGGLNNGKFVVNYDDIDFDDDLKNSLIKKSFSQFVYDSLNPDGKKEISAYDFHCNAYFMLDLLGISKEPAKTVKFRNVLNDGFHSYYGGFCDYVVSDDNGFIKKSRVLYKLFGIETKVFHIDEFINYFNLLRNSFEPDVQSFSDLLIHDLATGLVLGSKKSIKFNRVTTYIKPAHYYIGHFNYLENMVEDGVNYILFSKTSKNYSNFDFYREYKLVINNLLRLFGEDIDLKGDFKWEEEIEEIKNHNWAGRRWELGKLKLILEINEGSKKFCMLIALK